MNKKESKFGEKLLFFFGLLIFVFLLISLNKNLNKAKKIREMVSNLKKEIKIGEKNEKELLLEIEKQKTTKYVEERLRNDLFLVKDGETVVVLPDDPVVENYGMIKKEEVEETKMPAWKKWLYEAFH